MNSKEVKIHSEDALKPVWLTSQINKQLEKKDVEVIDIKFLKGAGEWVAAFILYKENNKED